jgi:hypothetical protein
MRASGSASAVSSMTPKLSGPERSTRRAARVRASMALARLAAVASATALDGPGRGRWRLVAAHAADDVALADVGDQALGDRLQRRVAGGVAVAVVDRLEAVEVEIDEAGRRAVALGEGLHAGQLAHEGAAVEQRGQRVAVGQALGLAEPRLQPATSARRSSSSVSSVWIAASPPASSPPPGRRGTRRCRPWPSPPPPPRRPGPGRACASPRKVRGAPADLHQAIPEMVNGQST